MESRSYTISIRNQEFSFICSDGQDYVDALQTSLNNIVDQLYTGPTIPHLSDFAFKLAISLADQSASKELEDKSKTLAFQERIAPLLDQLDLLVDDNQSPEVDQELMIEPVANEDSEQIVQAEVSLE
jgi:hypothetical protein